MFIRVLTGGRWFCLCTCTHMYVCAADLRRRGLGTPCVIALHLNIVCISSSNRPSIYKESLSSTYKARKILKLPIKSD